jgi:hypothetical protein
MANNQKPDKATNPKVRANAAALHASNQAKNKTNTAGKPTPRELGKLEDPVYPLPRGKRGK